mmetsp:Transcript_7852/g.12773  ORF Transcript_7852/g.12773 Transcript_7852/m.12773 type:complete len:640 (+) Transcript_7852:40-1959(+)
MCRSSLFACIVIAFPSRLVAYGHFLVDEVVGQDGGLADAIGDSVVTQLGYTENGVSRRLGCNFQNLNDDRFVPLFISLPCMVVLILFSSFFSALSLGVMGMDVSALDVIEKGDDEELVNCATKIKTIRQNGNLLNVSLMLGKVLMNAMFAILSVDALNLFYGLGLTILATLFIGEILPQAVCTKYALQVGACMVPFAQVWIALFYILAKPIAAVLWVTLKREMGTAKSRAEIFARLKEEANMNEAQNAQEEAERIASKVAEGAMLFRNKEAHEVMTPLNDAYMLPSSTRLGYTAIKNIFDTGFTRIPVYGNTKNDYRGLLVTKDLMLADPEDEMKLGDFIQIFQRKVETFYQGTKLAEVLIKFKQGGTHMGLVREVNTQIDVRPCFEIRGVITLEDVIEEILQDEIVDETDVYKDVDKQEKVNDGRETRVLNLAVFNPLWKSKTEELSQEEVKTIAAHLERTCFGPDGNKLLRLSFRAIEWLVKQSGVQNRKKVTPHGIEDIDPKDILYDVGQDADKCTLVVQGRVGIKAGRDGFRSEAGAFSILARDCLKPGEHFKCDYRAFIQTEMVRLVAISKAHFLEAQILDQDRDRLEKAFGNISHPEAVDSSHNGFMSGDAVSYIASPKPCEVTFEKRPSLME